MDQADRLGVDQGGGERHRLAVSHRLHPQLLDIENQWGLRRIGGSNRKSGAVDEQMIEDERGLLVSLLLRRPRSVLIRPAGWNVEDQALKPDRSQVARAAQQIQP